MYNKLKHYINAAIGLVVVMIFLGATLFVLPEMSLDIIRWTFTITLLVLGATLVAIDLTRTSAFSIIHTSIGGILLMLLGLITMIYPNSLQIIPIALGIWFVVSSFASLRLSLNLRVPMGGSWILAAITSVLSAICGFVLIFFPIDGSIIVTQVIGVMLMIYGVVWLIDIFAFRSKIDEIAKYVKKSYKEIK